MNNQKKHIIVASVLVVVLLVAAAAGMTAYSFFSPILRGEVALVNPDEDDRAAMADIQKELTQQNYATSNIGTENKTSATANQSIQSIGTKRTTPATVSWKEGNIPSAILTVPQKDAAVTNMLLIMDGDFYLVSMQQHAYTLYPIPGNLYVPVQGMGWTTLQNAYTSGGIACAVNTINTALNTDVQHYVFWSSDGLWRISDLMGGLEVNLTRAEADAMNATMGTAYTQGPNTLWEGSLDTYSKLNVNGSPAEHWKTAAGAIYRKAKADKRTGQLVNAVKSGLSTDVSFNTLKGLAEQYISNTEQADLNNLLIQQCTGRDTPAGTIMVADLPATAKKLHKAIYGTAEKTNH